MPSAFVPSWLNPPDFLGASEAGARLGLSREEMLQQAEEHAAQLAVERDRIGAENQARNQALLQRNQNANAALALREAALKQAGILGAARNQNQAEAVSATAGLDQAKEAAMRDKAAQLLKDRQAQETKNELAWFDKDEASRAKEDAAKKKADAITAAATLKSNQLTPMMKDLIFKNSLGEGGTNFDAGMQAVRKYSGQPAPEDMSAGASLQPPSDTGTAGAGLPDLSGVPSPATGTQPAPTPQIPQGVASGLTRPMGTSSFIQPQAGSAADKAAYANQLAQKNPSLSRKEILDAVDEQFPSNNKTWPQPSQ